MSKGFKKTRKKRTKVSYHLFCKQCKVQFTGTSPTQKHLHKAIPPVVVNIATPGVSMPPKPIRASGSTYVFTPEHRANIGARVRERMTPEFRANIAAKTRERMKDPKEREKISKALKGNDYGKLNKGKKYIEVIPKEGSIVGIINNKPPNSVLLYKKKIWCPLWLIDLVATLQP